MCDQNIVEEHYISSFATSKVKNFDASYDRGSLIIRVHHVSPS